MKFSHNLLCHAVSLAALMSSYTALAFTPPAVFENTEFARTIDVTGSYIRETVSVTVKNIGSEPESVYYYAIDPESYANIAVFEGRERSVSGKNKRAGLLDVQPSELTNEEEGVNYYEIPLLAPLQPGEETVIQLGIALVNKIYPSPRYATQGDSQFLAVSDNRFALSAYPSVLQTLKVNTVGLKVTDESAKELQVEEDARAEEDSSVSAPFDLSPKTNGNILEYGPYKQVPPYFSSPFVVRYEYPRAVAKVVKLERNIWVSHWGASASFEESYELHNFGTQLEGNAFSRLEYMRRSTQYNLNSAALKGLEVTLPESSREIFYTDLVGNVSTSLIKPSTVEADSIGLVLKPRYPLFGGWNYNFTIGWSVDLNEYVAQPNPSETPEKYILRVPLIQGPTEMPYDEVIVNIILPEGATDIDLAALHPAVPESVLVTKSYLDFAGRPTLRLVYNNLIDNYKRTSVYVTYNYTAQSAYMKPLIVSAIFGGMFTLALLISKVDISVSSFKPKTKKVE